MPKIDTFRSDPVFASLPESDKALLAEQADRYRLSVQDLRGCIAIAADIRCWELGSIGDYWPSGRAALDRKAALAELHAWWNDRKLEGPDYSGEPEAGTRPAGRAAPRPARLTVTDEPARILGRCPVYSPATRCCGLWTLDAVRNCAFGCSYCSIQSFFFGDEVIMYDDLAGRLARIEAELDPETVYHIGTGQSSDSLVWGNRLGNLDALNGFAARNPNVIVELKTKSADVEALLDREVAANMLVTWSLNDPAVARWEEHGTASVEARLRAARTVADAGALVGFHVHPIIRHREWQSGYDRLVDDVVSLFEPCEVAMVSIGTLTYTKPVVRRIRAAARPTRALQMPLTETAGKLSYPIEWKAEMFARLYAAFARWRCPDGPFFYLCMEDPSLWRTVFGYEYATNDEFEIAMTSAYLRKITALRDRRRSRTQEF
ncbi:MAG: DNA photolyase [Spirochaetaceae bacterium]|nr:MAG: DNA photolyase [Spirochaetaceae bacterium]